MIDQDVLIKEYESLKGEINQKIELHNFLTMFMITTVIAILAFALESDNPVSLYIMLWTIFVLFLVAWEILITLRIKGIDKEKNDWIKKWENLENKKK